MFRFPFAFLLAGAALLATAPSPSPTALSLDDAIRVAWLNDPHTAALALTGLIQTAATLTASQLALPGTATTPIAAGPIAWLEVLGYRVALEM